MSHPRCFWLSLIFLAALAVVVGCEAGTGDDNASAGDDDDDDNDNDDDNNDDTTAPRRIDRQTLAEKILGSWAGQMAGVTWAASTEFHYTGRRIPDAEVPEWRPPMVNWGFFQDDVYVEIPLLDALAREGVRAGWDVLGAAFRDTRFPLWHANEAARDNLRAGMGAPESGHYTVNEHCDDIDWQIEADFVGTMCPGLVNEAIDIAWRAGHVMNYGDGVLGGVFLAAMHAAAFFADDLAEIIAAGRRSLPERSKYRAVVDDVREWHAAGYEWEETWQLLQDKWGTDDRCPSYDMPLMRGHNIDAKLNGAYVLIGLLYGAGDFTESMRIAMQCGQDSDCNPSSVGGILGNWRGFEEIPAIYTAELDPTRKFLFTDWSLDEAVAANLELAIDVLDVAGATADGEGDDETWTLPPVEPVRAPLLEQWPENENVPPVLTARVATQNGRRVEFTATATDADGIAEFEWYFGDLSRAAGPEVVHEFATRGTYEAIAYVADPIGNTSWQILAVTVP